MKLIISLFTFLSSINMYGQIKGTAENKFIFFLHNRFLEEAGLEGVHPEYGKVEYQKIIDAFKASGFEVISEVRKKNTSVTDYAGKTVRQIDSLIRSGIQPTQITVIGTSKGGYIAMFISSMLKNPKVNYVFIGCCSLDNPAEIPDVNFCGNILSIYEKSDNTSSCLKMKEKSTNTVPRFQELELNTGLKHGFLYKALPEWIGPSIHWANDLTAVSGK